MAFGTTDTHNDHRDHLQFVAEGRSNAEIAKQLRDEALGAEAIIKRLLILLETRGLRDSEKYELAEACIRLDAARLAVSRVLQTSREA